MVTEENRTYWNEIARQFHQIGSPLRPGPADIATMQTAVASWQQAHVRKRLKALLCGVTPEIAEMNWPEQTELLAVDLSEAMIGARWPGDIPGRRRAERGNWLTLSQPDNFFDLVVGDGCFSCLVFPAGYHALAASYRRVLQPDGIFILRFYVSPEVPEDPQDVMRDLLAGGIGSFHAFKWRLAMSLQSSAEQGIRLHDIWQYWINASVDRAALIKITNWSEDAINTIDYYQGLETHWSFPTLKAVQELLSESCDLLSVSVADYELAERCPIMVYRPRKQ